MRFPGRLSAAIEILAEVETRHRPVSEALKGWGISNRFAGAGDRAAIGNLVYDALRRRASHAFAMGEETPRALVLSVAVRDWGVAPEQLTASFADDAHAPAALTADEVARLEAENPLADAPPHVRADLPEWAGAAIKRNFGNEWVAEGEAMSLRPPLDLRVNTLKSSRERVLKSLARLSPEETAVSPLGIRFPAGPSDARTPNVQADEGYLKGWFEVQDQGSQIVAALIGARPGEQVLDLCAGAGGKTLAMAASMDNKGQIFAFDSDRNRLAPIYDRLKRNGVRNAQVR
ncbi:MAG TPA: class I SAM-dependent methyltransferase, partial [Devosiaceae bacterium]|nr:class I SAM-dependent methyltransferase [Devosiaceae bacterium]